MLKEEKRKNALYFCSKKDNFENLLPNKENKYIQAKNNVKCHKKLSRKIKSSKSFINSYFTFFSLILLIVLKPDLYHSKKIELRHLSYDNYIVITVTKNWEGDQVNQIFSWEASNDILPNKIKINTNGNEYETSDIQKSYTLSGDSTLTLIWTRQLTSCFKMFYKVPRIKTIDLSHFDLSLVTDMGSFFDNCYQLQYINLSNGDARNVENMNWMFSYDTELTSLDFSNFRTDALKTMEGAFYHLINLKSLDLSTFSATQVTIMRQAFSECERLESLEIRNFNAKHVTDLSLLFKGCYALKYIDLRNFDTSSVVQMEDMFWDCHSLTSVEISSFDTSHVEIMGHMFFECRSL